MSSLYLPDRYRAQQYDWRVVEESLEHDASFFSIVVEPTRETL